MIVSSDQRERRRSGDVQGGLAVELEVVRREDFEATVEEVESEERMRDGGGVR